MTTGPAPLRVLVVDDEPDVVTLLRFQLGAEPDIEVVGTAGDGEEAVAFCRDTPPDAVVMDLLMPRMTGFEAIDILRREQPGLAIVAYTAVAGAYVRETMTRFEVPLVLKSGDVEPLAGALRAAAGRAAAT